MSSMPTALRPIELRAKLRRRFYEAVKLEEALVKACLLDPESSDRVPADFTVGIEYGAQQAFRSLVNKIAHVCDTHRGGPTVSAMAVIQEFDGVHYFLSSNERSKTQEVELLKFLKSIIQSPTKEMKEDPSWRTILFDQRFRLVIKFNQPRIQYYVKSLVEHLDYCSDGLDQKTDQDSQYLQAFLREIKGITQFHRASKCDEAENSYAIDLKGCAELIEAINLNHQKGRIAEAMFKQSREDKIGSSKPWLEIRHAMARLRAYWVSTETIAHSQERWPELFENYHITIFPSSEPHINPINNKTVTAKELIGRMDWSADIVEKRRADAEHLQRFGLDEIIQKACSSENFTPLVHSEIIVHDGVRSYLADNPNFKYWNDWSYVGSSKPTCRLCHYYFYHVNDVSVRESHSNLYSRWRLPDVFDEESASARDRILNRMAERIRLDALRTMRDKLPRGQANDSSSFPTVEPWFKKSEEDTQAISDTSSILGNKSSWRAAMVIHQPRVQAKHQASQVLHLRPRNEDDIDEEGDGGGLLLFTGRKNRVL